MRLSVSFRMASLLTEPLFLTQKHYSDISKIVKTDEARRPLSQGIFRPGIRGEKPHPAIYMNNYVECCRIKGCDVRSFMRHKAGQASALILTVTKSVPNTE